MSPVPHLLARVAEDTNQGPNNTTTTDRQNKPSLGIILAIVYLSVFFFLFFTSLFYYWRQENKRKTSGQSFRKGHVLWKATCVATGLWIWAWLPKALRLGSASRKSQGTVGSGPYQNLEGKQNASAVALSARPPGSIRSVDSRSSTPTGYGIPASQIKKELPPALPDIKFELYGDSPASLPPQKQFAPHDAIPMVTLSPSQAPPPIYISKPATAAIYDQKLPPRYPDPGYY
ncbi:hypothetical protein F4861DRAFT_537602 [Xylaria intraflava]|nr:hypothetical protein F4861DRAFT_537602 [Xylaria intraflava]